MDEQVFGFLLRSHQQECDTFKARIAQLEERVAWHAQQESEKIKALMLERETLRAHIAASLNDPDFCWDHLVEATHGETRLLGRAVACQFREFGQHKACGANATRALPRPRIFVCEKHAAHWSALVYPDHEDSLATPVSVKRTREEGDERVVEEDRRMRARVEEMRARIFGDANSKKIN